MNIAGRLAKSARLRLAAGGKAALAKGGDAFNRLDELGGDARDAIKGWWDASPAAGAVREMWRSRSGGDETDEQPDTAVVAANIHQAAEPVGLGDSSLAVQVFGARSCPWSGRATRVRPAWIPLFAIALASCVDDSGLTKLDGVYAITVWTENTEGCDAEGPSVATERSDTGLFIREDELFDVTVVNVVLCEDPDRCAARAADDDSFEFFGFRFSDGGDDVGWAGTNTSLEATMAGVCLGEVRDLTLASSMVDQVRVEIRTTDVAGLPLGVNRACDEQAAIEAAREQSCDRLEVIEAVLGGTL